jgi:hypothetical protein
MRTAMLAVTLTILGVPNATAQSSGASASRGVNSVPGDSVRKAPGHFTAKDAPSAESRAERAVRLSAAEHARRTPDFIRGDDIGDRLAWIARGTTAGASMGRSADLQTYYLLVRRASTSGSESHARWDDFVIVRSGKGALLFGEQMTGGHSPLPGERRGGVVVKPQRFVLSAGNIVRIPAGVPHSFVAEPGAPLEYLLIKVRKPNLPLD